MLRAGSAEQAGHGSGVSVVLVHGRQSQQVFDGPHHVHGGEEMVLDKCPLG
jgi:hypothetical protein